VEKYEEEILIRPPPDEDFGLNSFI